MSTGELSAVPISNSGLGRRGRWSVITAKNEADTQGEAGHKGKRKRLS